MHIVFTIMLSSLKNALRILEKRGGKRVEKEWEDREKREEDRNGEEGWGIQKTKQSAHACSIAWTMVIQRIASVAVGGGRGEGIVHTPISQTSGAYCPAVGTLNALCCFRCPGQLFWPPYRHLKGKEHISLKRSCIQTQWRKSRRLD